MKKPNLLMIITFSLLLSAGLLAQENEKVPYVPSPIEVVDRMLEFADVKKEDVVFDIGSGNTKIVLWHHWDGAYFQAIQKIFADYATKNNVQIEMLYVPDVSNKAQVAVPSGQGPDIISWVDDRIGDSALNKIIVPLDEYGITPEYLKSTFAPVAGSF